MRPPWPHCTPTAGGVTTGRVLRRLPRRGRGRLPAGGVGRRFERPDPRARTIVAELDGEVAGLAHTRLGRTPPGARSWTTCTSVRAEAAGGRDPAAGADGAGGPGLHARIGPLPVGARAERRRPRLLLGPRRQLRRDRRRHAARRRPGPAERPSDGPEVRSAGPVQAAADAGLTPGVGASGRRRCHGISKFEIPFDVWTTRKRVRRRSWPTCPCCRAFASWRCAGWRPSGPSWSASWWGSGRRRACRRPRWQRGCTSQSAVARQEGGTADVRTSTLERYAAAVGGQITSRLDG